MTYSEDDYRFTVKAEADEITGGLVVTEVTEFISPEADVKKPEIEYDEETGEYSVRVRFANQYEASPVPVDPDPVKAYITVEKKMEYKNAGEGDKIGPAGFLFTLEEDSVADDRHQKRTDAEGNAVFELEYDKDDAGKTYIYSLKEVDEGAAGVEYSDAEYDVRVAVTERDNILSAAVTCEDRAMDTFEFINVYDCGAGEDGPTDSEDPENPDGPDGPGGSGESGDGSGDSGDSDGDGLGGGTGESGKDAASKTGDDSNMVLPFAAMLTSAAIIALLAVECRRRKV